MEQRSTNGSSGRRKRLTLLAGALLLAALAAIPASNLVLAQEAPPGGGLALLNEDEGFVQRTKDGGFIARPVFDRQIDLLYYGLRHPDTGDWITALYRVQGGEQRLGGGWEYTWEYPVLAEQPELDSEQAYLLVVVVPRAGGGEPDAFHAVAPVYEPRGLWDRVLRALDPSRWARAAAGWVIEGVHGTLCGVVERATGNAGANCRGS